MNAMKGRPQKSGEAPLRAENRERAGFAERSPTPTDAPLVAGNAPTEPAMFDNLHGLGVPSVSTTNEKRYGRLGPFMVVVPALVVVSAIGFSTLGGIGAVSLQGSLALGWSLLLGFIALRLARSESRRAALANGSVFLATLALGVMAGGGLPSQLLLSAGLSTPSTTFTMIHPLRRHLQPVHHHHELPYGVVAHTRSVVPQLAHPQAQDAHSHSGCGVLRDADLVLRLLRAQYLRVRGLPPDGPFSAEVVERFRMWVNLNWLRIAIQDVLTYLLFLLAAFVPASATGTIRKQPGERAVEKEAQSA